MSKRGPASALVPVCLSVGESRPHRVGWVMSAEVLPAFLRALADAVENAGAAPGGFAVMATRETLRELGGQVAASLRPEPKGPPADAPPDPDTAAPDAAVPADVDSGGGPLRAAQ